MKPNNILQCEFPGIRPRIAQLIIDSLHSVNQKSRRGLPSIATSLGYGFVGKLDATSSPRFPRNMPGYQVRKLNRPGLRLRREVSTSMAVAKTKILSSFFWIMYLIGTLDSTQNLYRNIWAVKVHGTLQDAKQLSFKRGFVYDKHVSSSTLTLVKSTQNPFYYHHCIVETRIAKNGNALCTRNGKLDKPRLNLPL